MTSLDCVGCAVGDTSGGRAEFIYFMTWCWKVVGSARSHCGTRTAAVVV